LNFFIMTESPCGTGLSPDLVAFSVPLKTKEFNGNYAAVLLPQ
jgi:hypothetical protein